MLGILCGLEQEATIARAIPGALVACAAARPHKARDLAHELITKGATRLISFGIAGSLESSLRIGDLVIGTRVISRAGQWACDEAWGRLLGSTLAGLKKGSVYGSETLVATVAAKEELYRTTGCVIVDMESQCAAEVAAAAGVPLMVIRAVCDDSNMNVPSLVMAAIADDGRIRVGTALSHLLFNPLQLVDLFHVMRGTHQALKALKLIKDRII